MKKYLVWILGILLLLSACDLKKPIIPQWDVTLKVPLLNEIYPVLDLVDGENILIDADSLMYLSTTGQMETPPIGEVEITPNVDVDGIPVPSGVAFDSNLPLLDPGFNVRLTYGSVSSGEIKVKFADIDPSVTTLRLIFHDITTDAGDPLEVNFDNSGDWQAVDLAAYHFGVKNSQTDLTELHITAISASGQPDNTPIASMGIKIDSPIAFDEFQGRFDHFMLPLNVTAGNVDIEYPYGLDQAVHLQAAKLILNLENDLGFSCEFVGDIYAVNADGESRTIPIKDNDGNNYIITGSTIEGVPAHSTIVLEDNISQLLQIMPTHIEVINSNFIIDSQSGLGSLRSSDVIRANYDISAPFVFELFDQMITVQEPVKIEISAENRTQIRENAQGATLDFKILNKLPIGAEAKVYFGNDANIDPTNSNTWRFFVPAEVFALGDTAADLDPEDGFQMLSITLSKSDLDTFTEPEVYLRWTFNFHPTGDFVPIHATTADYIHIKSMVNATLRMGNF